MSAIIPPFAPARIPGEIRTFGGSTIPPGWLLCDGSAVSRTTYAALYAALGGAASPHGQGNGTTTFNVPDLQGRVAMGAGSGAGLTARANGAKGGAESVALGIGDMPTHDLLRPVVGGVVRARSEGSLGRRAGSLRARPGYALSSGPGREL
jgi:microcystin-dependent protein